MSTFARVTLLLTVFLAAGSAVSVAPGAVATFTPTGDDSIGSWPYYEYNNEGGLYWTMVGQMGESGGLGMDQRFVTRFNVSSLGGMPNLQVNSITLRLFSAGINIFNPGVTIHPEVHPVTAANREWVEGPGDVNKGGDGTVVVPGTASWSAKITGPVNNPTGPGFAPWAGGAGLTVPGIDYDSTVLTTRTLIRL